MPETKIFSKLDLLFMKSHIPFDLRLKKKLVITYQKIFEWGIDLESNDLAQKIDNLVKQKGWHIFKAFLWKNEFFENQAL